MRTTRSLFGDLDVDVTTDAPLGAMTWYAIGGRADLLVVPRSTEALETLVKRCRRSRTPLQVLGEGANLLVADEGVDGIVARLDSPALKDIQYKPNDDGELLRAMAGADMARTLMDAARRGLAGLEQMAGIPATIGGAIRMNAGGAFGAISDHLRTVTCITRTGEKVTYPASEIKFDYRRTNIPDPVILSATFQLTPTDPIALRERIKEIFTFKKKTQPLAEKSAGCTFKNPLDPVTEQRVPAGKLIDDAGLKGFAIGGASISERHANFIVTKPGATASDVIAVLDEAKRRVYESAGLELQEEVVIWRRSREAL